MNTDIEQYRKEINRLDAEMFKLLEERFALVEKIGESKKTQGLPVRNQEREEALIGMMSEQTTLAPDFVKRLYGLIFNYSYKLEE